jgi:hypothetical protein
MLSPLRSGEREEEADAYHPEGEGENPAED